jgi:hypothetical protein
MKLIDNLLQSREEKRRILIEKISARDEARRAVTLAKKLATTLPDQIRQLEVMMLPPSYSTQCAEEDAVHEDMIHRAENINAMKRLLADLPDILSHWEERLIKLTGAGV